MYKVCSVLHTALVFLSLSLHFCYSDFYVIPFAPHSLLIIHAWFPLFPYLSLTHSSVMCVSLRDCLSFSLYLPLISSFHSHISPFSLIPQAPKECQKCIKMAALEKELDKLKKKMLAIRDQTYALGKFTDQRMKVRTVMKRRYENAPFGNGVQQRLCLSSWLVHHCAFNTHSVATAV